METSNLSRLGVGTTSSQTSLEEKRLSGLCSSRMLLGSSSTTGSIQSCDVTDILSRSNNGIAGGFLSPTTTSSNLDCTLKCSVTVAVPALGSSFRSIGGSRPEPEIRITTNSKNKQLEELLHMSENERFDYDDDSGNNTPNIFLNQEDSQENPNEDDYEDDDDNEDEDEEVGECDSDFDGLDLEDDDHDPVPLGDILDKLQANAALNYSHCSKKESPDNLIQLHAAQDDNDSQTISATVNVAALDLSDPDSIYRHLSELNDTVLRVSAKNSSPAPGSGQQSPMPFLDSPDIGNDASQCQDAMTPNSSTRSSSPANSRSENSDLSSMAKICSISLNGTTSICSSTQIFLNKNSTFLPSNIQLPTSPLALAVSCSTPSPSMLCSPLPSVSRSSSVPCSPNVLTKSSSSSNLATKSTPQSCAICYKVFSNASALAKHRLTHSEERRYHCSICSKAFKRQDHLNGHLLTHRSTKPFACQVDGCGKSYCDARSLRRHKENHHASGLKHHHHHHTLVSLPNASAPTPTPTLAIASKSETVNVESSSPTVTRSTVGDTKIMFSSKGLTAQQLQLIEQLLKESRGGKIVSLPSNPNLSTLQPHPPPPPPINISFPLSQNSSKPTCNISSPQISPVISTLNIAVKRVASPEKGFIPIGSDKPVECTICNRKFKNIPALNGHMRLHGGYYKKDSEGKKILTSAALRQNLKGTKFNSAFSKNNLKRKCGITLEETSAKKTSLCPVNLQTSLSNLQPITPASLSGMCMSNNNTTNSGMINITSALEQKVPFESQARFSSSVCHMPQPSLAFQSLPPPDTNKLLENLEKKNFPLMLIKNDDVHKFSTYDGSLKYAKDKAPMKLKALPAHHSKGIGTKETRTAVVCESKSTQNHVTYTIGLPPIALPTKPVPKLQLEESKSTTKFTQVNSPLVTQALKVKFPSATEQIQDSKDFLCTLQKPIEFKNTGSTCVAQEKKENTNLIFFPDSQGHSRNSDVSEATFHGISLLAKTEAASAGDSEKGTTLSSNQQMNYFHNNNFEEFIESNTSLSQFLQSSSCQSVLNQLRASPLTKSHLMLRVDNSSDKNPKIGRDHQADIPDQIIKSEEVFDMEGNYHPAKDVLVWSPDDLLDEKSLEDYLQVASSCAILLGSHNEELALELLHKHSGKVDSALQDLLSLTNRTPDEDEDTDFDDESEESDMDMDPGTAQSQRMKQTPWTEHEVNSFYEGLVKYKKNFSKISHFVETKTVKECVQFYYLWKNFCHDEAHSFKNIFYSECSGNTKCSAMNDPAGTETFAIKIEEEKPESTSS